MINRKNNVVPFPQKATKPKPKSTIKNVDGIKYYTELQIKLLRRTARDAKPTLSNIRQWMAIDLLTSTGVRVAEAADLRCGDIKSGYGESSIFVRCGKCHQSRTIQIPDSLRKHLKQFLKWKANRNEPVDEDDYLFVGERGPWTGQAIQQIVKTHLRQLGLYEKGKAVHALRHSYAVHYYSKSNDLKGLQKQLGHQSIQNTQIYADVTTEQIQENIKRLWQ